LRFRDPYIDLSPASSTFLCPLGACSTFLDLQIYSICFICSWAFHCQLTMMVLTSEPCKIDFRYEEGKLAPGLPNRFGQEVQD
jgi:hypothetical protein